mmetsp:Transcript_68058/g.149429  ORF Transcript_68058/g.149429 Transcript_68058/m.149429 type:complete len:118 (-) Transcript_68058:836-1189(-)
MKQRPVSSKYCEFQLKGYDEDELPLAISGHKRVTDFFHNRRPSNTATHLQNTMSGLMVKPRKAARISRSPLSPTSRQTCGPNLRPTMRAVVVVALLEEETAMSSARIAPRENLTPHV